MAGLFARSEDWRAISSVAIWLGMCMQAGTQDSPFLFSIEGLVAEAGLVAMMTVMMRERTAEEATRKEEDRWRKCMEGAPRLEKG